MAKKQPQSGDEAEDQVTVEGGVVAVLTEDPNPEPSKRRRRVQRREEIQFTQEERIKVEQEIIAANKGMREVEAEKSTQNKTWNAAISEYRDTLDEAVDVLDKGSFTIDVERIEEFNYDSKMVIYYNVETGVEEDSRDMTEEELQTKMNM